MTEKFNKTSDIKMYRKEYYQKNRDMVIRLASQWNKENNERYKINQKQSYMRRQLNNRKEQGN